jgi:hypothetical protein
MTASRRSASRFFSRKRPLSPRSPSPVADYHCDASVIDSSSEQKVPSPARNYNALAIDSSLKRRVSSPITEQDAIGIDSKSALEEPLLESFAKENTDGEIGRTEDRRLTERVCVTLADSVEERQRPDHVEDSVMGPSVPRDSSTNVNVFAKFAFAGATTESRPKLDSTLNSFRAVGSKSYAINVPKSPKVRCKKDWIPMNFVSPSQRSEIVQKWHSMASSEALLEDRRFEVLIAARLHARCQEGTTRKAMTQLRERLGAILTVATVARSEPEDFVDTLSCLQYYSTKAKHIVKAAREIVSQFNGEVPERKDHLLTLTGIGPVFADLLAVVNTRSMHRHHLEQQSFKESLESS